MRGFPVVDFDTSVSGLYFNIVIRATIVIYLGSSIFAICVLSSQNVRSGRTRTEMFRENVYFLHFD